MRKQYKLSDKNMHKCRREIISTIDVYDYSNNLRSVFDDTLSFNNKASEDILEYKESNIKHNMVNHIRHQNSSYESGLRDIYRISSNQSQGNRNLNYHLYKNATLAQIAKVYPFLEKECKQQKTRINMIRIKKN